MARERGWFSVYLTGSGVTETHARNQLDILAQRTYKEIEKIVKEEARAFGMDVAVEVDYEIEWDDDRCACGEYGWNHTECEWTREMDRRHGL